MGNLYRIFIRKISIRDTLCAIPGRSTISSLKSTVAHQVFLLNILRSLRLRVLCVYFRTLVGSTMLEPTYKISFLIFLCDLGVFAVKFYQWLAFYQFQGGCALAAGYPGFIFQAAAKDMFFALPAFLYP